MGGAALCVVALTVAFGLGVHLGAGWASGGRWGLSSLTCTRLTGIPQSWCARAWRRAGWAARAFPDHCLAEARKWFGDLSC